jgi:hypothetical protein
MRINNKNNINIIIWLLIIIISAMASTYIAYSVHGTDFPVYYTTAKRMIDPQFSAADIYQTTMQGLDILPERYLPGNYFIYSPIVAALLSPLGYLPYFTAKSVLLFLNIIAYFIAIALLLKQFGRCTWRHFVTAILFTWMPFIINFCGAQVNAFILLLIACAIYLANGKRAVMAGSLLGLATMFKIFPLGVAGILGFHNRNITVACVTLFIVSLLAPGTWQWFQAVPTVSSGHTPIYLLARQYGIGWQLFYSVSVVLFSAYCLFEAKTNDLLALSAYSIPAVFVALPVIQYHHLIILTVTYIIIFYTTSSFTLNPFLKVVLILTILHINLDEFWEFLPSTYWSILVMWVALSWTLLKVQVTDRRRHTSIYQETENRL